MARDSARAFLTIVLVVFSVLDSERWPGSSRPRASIRWSRSARCSRSRSSKSWLPGRLTWILSRTAKEEPIGPQGSSCNYPGADIQVMSFSRSMIDIAKKDGGLEPVSGIGDEAYVHNNQDRYAELYARVGPHLLTVQLDIPNGKKFDSTRPQLIELGKAFAAKLR